MNPEIDDEPDMEADDVDGYIIVNGEPMAYWMPDGEALESSEEPDNEPDTDDEVPF